MDPEPPSLIISSFSDNTPLVLGFVLLVVLLACSALVSGAEIAMFSLTRSDIDKELNKGSKKFEIVSRLLERPKKLLATILVANNFINVGIVILFAYLSEFIFYNISLGWVRFMLEVVLVTFLILLFGEIIPKVYASRNRIGFSNFVAIPMNTLNTVFSPLSIPMRGFTILIQNRLGKQRSNISVDQLSQALELTNESNTTHEEQKILKGIVSFGNTDTKQVMKPRIDIFALQMDEKYVDILPKIVENGYSRIPVYKDSIDTVVGILYIKDLLPFLDRKQFDWNSLLRDPFFVPENKKLDDLMVEFQNKKVHLAIVVDEYGGTSGIVSLEDVIEEIVGDISDEFDDEDLVYTKIDDHNYLFEGKTPLKDFYKIVGLENNSDFDDNKGEAETIAGFVLEISGIFPRRGSKINFKNYVFTIEALDRKRIKQIKFTILK